MKSMKKRLKNLIRHCWVHSAYRDCGYDQMDQKLRKLYRKVIGRKKKDA